MNILLDTHIWLWYLLGAQRLSLQLKMAIATRKSNFWVLYYP
ncbi:MAG: hypothetical protein WBA93_31280 [Microcoleaceae cyanobacterium]